ncbi:MAG: sialidase family protein [Actinomycetota bacterium]
MRRVLGAVFSVTVLVAAAQLAMAARAPSPGCSATRKATAADARGHILQPQPPGAPIPCGTRTGFGGGETRIFATSHAVIYAPAVFTPGPAGTGYAPQAPGPRFQFLSSPSALAMTKDNGGTWKAVLPLGMTWQPSDEQEYVDRATGRFFFYNFGGNPFPQTAQIPSNPDAALFPGMEAQLAWSADDGATWHHATTCCPALSENPRFVAARAPKGGPQSQGYPNVVYFCGNVTVMLLNQVPNVRVCSRSLDGGSTWSVASVLISHPVPQHPECGSTGEDFGPTDGSYPQAMPDGSLVVLVSCGATYLARSTDEGSTWPIVRTAAGAPLPIPAFSELRTDPKGNLYRAMESGGHIELRVSRNAGLTWGSPMIASAPGITVGEAWNLTVRAPGEVAVSYYGERADGQTADGYLTATRNALDADPIFWSATVNDPQIPMLNDGSSRPPTGGIGFLDFNGVDIAPDGTPWASFIQDCGANDVDPPCGDGTSHAMWGARGFAGRLLWPRPSVR